MLLCWEEGGILDFYTVIVRTKRSHSCPALENDKRWRAKPGKSQDPRQIGHGRIGKTEVQLNMVYCLAPLLVLPTGSYS